MPWVWPKKRGQWGMEMEAGGVVSKAVHSLVFACNVGLASFFRPTCAAIPSSFLAQGLRTVVSATWILYPHALPI